MSIKNVFTLFFLYSFHLNAMETEPSYQSAMQESVKERIQSDIDRVQTGSSRAHYLNKYIYTVITEFIFSTNHDEGLELLDSLLKNGADPNYNDPSGFHPLVEVINWFNAVKRIQGVSREMLFAPLNLLISYGSDPEMGFAGGMTQTVIEYATWFKLDNEAKLMNEKRDAYLRDKYQHKHPQEDNEPIKSNSEAQADSLLEPHTQPNT